MIRSLLIHTCTLRKRTLSAGSAATFGQQVSTWAEYISGVPCRLDPMSSKEVADQAKEGTPSATHNLFVEFSAMSYTDPTKTFTDLATMAGAGTYQVTNVKDRSGTVIDAGPFDVKPALNLAGTGQLMKIQLVRVTKVAS
jgi:hypothetical protein